MIANPQIITLVVLDPGVDEKYAWFKMPEDGKLSAVNFAAQGGFTANDTNFIKLYVLDGGAAGAGTDIIGQYLGIATAGDGNLTDLAFFSDVINDVQLHKGDHVMFNYDEGGVVAPTSITVQVALNLGNPATAELPRA